jgi:ABC-type Fe3+ transport system permease subunit
MTYLGVIIGLIIMAATIYFAVNKKSNLAVRIACLAALALMMLTIIICLFIIFTDNRVPIDESVLIVGAPVEIKEEKNNNLWVMILLIIFLIAVFSVIVYLSLKEIRKKPSISDESPDISENFNF